MLTAKRHPALSPVLARDAEGCVVTLTLSEIRELSIQNEAYQPYL